MTKKTTATQVARNAKVENKVINSNPGYIFRTLNKRAQGRDKDAKEVEGYSRESLKELYTRLDAAFAAGGFWWGSVYAVNGRLVTSLSPLSDATAYYLDPDYTPDADHVLIHFAGQYFIGSLAKEWSENGVIDAAKARLSLVEKYAAAIDKEQEQEQKAQERKERKEERKAENKRKAQERKEQREQAQELAKTIQELKAQVKAGAISEEQAAAKVKEIFAA